jgi:hypothetical protein
VGDDSGAVACRGMLGGEQHRPAAVHEGIPLGFGQLSELVEEITGPSPASSPRSESTRM